MSIAQTREGLPDSPVGNEKTPGTAVAALAELAMEFPPRVSGRDARRLLGELRRRTGWSRDDYRALWADPEAGLGPFEDLPERLREALADAVAREMEERSVTTSERLRRRVYGPLFRLGSELSHRGRHLAARGPRWRRVGRNVYLCGRGLCWASERAGRAWLDVTRFTGPWETSGFHALWKWAGIDPMRPAIEYVREIPCDPRFSPVYRRPDRRVVSVMMVGLDLLPSDGRIYYIEANVNPGWMMQRLAFHPGEDPLLATLLDYCRREACDRLVVFPSSIASVSRELETKWREHARAAGVQLEIRDDPRVRSRYRRNCDPLMEPDAEGVLYLNVRTLPHPANVLLEEKGLFEAAIERHNARLPAEERIPVPRRILSASDVPPLDADGRFPNVVLKHALLNEARDIRLFRTEGLNEEMLRPPYVAFQFVPPETEERLEGGVRRQYPIKFRTFLLITPDGPLVTDSLKAVAGAPVPDRLEPGPVRDIRPYVLNSHAGSDHFGTTPEEHERAAAAALRIGWLVHDFLRRKHGPDWRRGGDRRNGGSR
jgi:hypothetical protein